MCIYHIIHLICTPVGYYTSQKVYQEKIWCYMLLSEIWILTPLGISAAYTTINNTI